MGQGDKMDKKQKRADLNLLVGAVWHFPSKHSLDSTWICWSPDELHIVGESEDGTAIIVGHSIRTNHSYVYAVRYSSDGETLVTSGYNNTITFRDVKRGAPLCRSIPFIAAALDNTISLWNPKNDKSVGRPLDHPQGSSGINKYVYIWSLQALFRDINVADGELEPLLGTSTAGHLLHDTNASIHPTGNNTPKGPRYGNTNILTPYVQLGPIARINYQGLLMRYQTLIFLAHRLRYKTIARVLHSAMKFLIQNCWPSR
ncbi:hypothetical protein C8R48DRAFT_763641 [Suillus tomentosus]|nr:hypothetical protein C8R48DRAFT_763641 [Suillus tomentosus]